MLPKLRKTSYNNRKITPVSNKSTKLIFTNVLQVVFAKKLLKTIRKPTIIGPDPLPDPLPDRLPRIPLLYTGETLNRRFNFVIKTNGFLLQIPEKLLY